MEKITMTYFDEVYTLFDKAFIAAELREYEKMKNLFQQGSFLIYGYFEDSSLVGAITVWEFENFIYLENFAVCTSMRGRGIGAKILKEIQNIYANKVIVLEVEKPTDDMKQRRIRFYQRAHFILNSYGYIQPALRTSAEKVELLLMTYPNVLNEKMYTDIKQQIFRVVYQQKI